MSPKKMEIKKRGKSEEQPSNKYEKACQKTEAKIIEKSSKIHSKMEPKSIKKPSKNRSKNLVGKWSQKGLRKGNQNQLKWTRFSRAYRILSWIKTSLLQKDTRGKIQGR